MKKQAESMKKKAKRALSARSDQYEPTVILISNINLIGNFQMLIALILKRQRKDLLKELDCSWNNVTKISVKMVLKIVAQIVMKKFRFQQNIIGWIYVWVYGDWGKEDAADIISQVKATTQLFKFFTNGSYDAKGDSGCAAILNDFPHRPIVARSKVFSEGQCVSPFILQLEGVALGVKLAMLYDPFPFYLYCPSESVCYFVDQNWRRRDKCRCSGIWETVESRCKACSKRLMFHGDHKDHEVAFELTEGIFSDISELKSRGLPWFSMRDSEKNEAAYHVASLLQDKEYKLKEIGESKELWDIIYTEAFGIFFE
ncbi:hypothetical protein MKX03_020722 [Papaver bracteatum]|nr:hypothetical protein MKX03_020722 [Papaver bracteatum]